MRFRHGSVEKGDYKLNAFACNHSHQQTNRKMRFPPGVRLQCHTKIVHLTLFAQSDGRTIGHDLPSSNYGGGCEQTGRQNGQFM